MAIELKRSLFIGLGGTGMKSVLKTKALYKEMFGDVPSVIGFLGIDTNATEFDTIAKEYGASFDAQEKVAVEINNADELYLGSRECFPWMSPKNLNVLSILRNTGAGQLRSSGRFMFENSYAKIKTAISRAMNSVSSATIEDTEKWALDDSQPVQVYVVFSLSGGTGCGTFLNIGYLLREMYGQKCDLYAYAVLPGSFANCGDYVGANAYGAALDVDFLMSNVDPDHPYEMTTMEGVKRYITKPYDLFYLIDNVNEFGARYNTQDQLHTMIGQALLNISGPLSSKIKSDYDNFKAAMAEGRYDKEDKKSWAMGHGLCEIMLDTNKLANLFSLKAGVNLVSAFIGVDDTLKMNEAAFNWVNRNNLCEHEADQLLDSLFDFANLPQSVIASTKSDDARVESDTWLGLNERKAGETIADSFDHKLSYIKKEFLAKLSEVIGSGAGFRGSKKFVESLLGVFEIYASEMAAELVDLNDSQTTLSARREKTLQQWKAAWGGAGKYGPQLQQDQAMLLQNKIDITRHVKASQFYAELKEYLTTIEANLAKAEELFVGVSKSFVAKNNALEVKKTVNPFQIDLTGMIAVGDHTDNTPEKFIATLNLPNILEIATWQTTELAEKILAFTKTLSGADFKQVSIQDLILSMPDEEIKKLFDKAMKKASVVLEINTNGLPVKDKTYAYVCVPNGTNGLMAQNETIKATLNAYIEGTDCNFVPATTSSSVMIYVHSGVYPMFQILRLMEQEREYNEKSEYKSFSFDELIEQRINDEHFGPMPNQRRDDDVLEMWVKGLIFGLIKKDGYRYFVKSKAVSNDDALGNYWAELNCGNEKMLPYQSRYHAFNDFKSKKKDLRSRGDLMEEIRKIEAAKGRDEVKRIYSEICNYSSEEYITKCSQVGLEPKTIRENPSYEKIKLVMKDEQKFINENLLSSIQ